VPGLEHRARYELLEGFLAILTLVSAVTMLCAGSRGGVNYANAVTLGVSMLSAIPPGAEGLDDEIPGCQAEEELISTHSDRWDR
jgi:hypothetical protein